MAVPFIESFLMESRQISLEKLIRPDIYKEIKVAERVCLRLKQERSQPGEYVLYTVGTRLIATQSNYLSSYDGERDFELLKIKEREIEKKWGANWFLFTPCLICDGGTIFVKVHPSKKPMRTLKPLAAECSKCELIITDSDKYLAEYHIDNIDDIAIKEFWNKYEEYVDE